MVRDEGCVISVSLEEKADRSVLAVWDSSRMLGDRLDEGLISSVGSLRWFQRSDVP